MSKKKNIILVFDIFLLMVLILADQLTKHIAIITLKDKQPKKVIDGVFEFHYLENRGAAFGMLQGQKIFFILIAVVILSAIVYILIKTPNHKMYTKLHISLVLIAGGAIGNLIDRVRYDYVVDFLYFSLINFPIFNVADIYVTLSSIWLVILLLFVYKEADLEFLSFKNNKNDDIK